MSDIFDRIKKRFVSGNSVPVDRAHITAEEWEEVEEEYETLRLTVMELESEVASYEIFQESDD